MKTFKDSGYIMMAVPRDDVGPLDLLYKSDKGVLNRENAPLYELFISQSIACPAISKDVDLPTDINTEENLDLSVESSLGLLDSLVKLIKTKLSAKFSYDKQSKIVLRLNNPKSNTINLLQLDRFLQAAVLDKTAADAAKKFDNGQLYVVVEIIKTKSFTLEDKNASQLAVNTDLSVSEIAAASGNISSGKEKNTSVTYTGDEYLTFGVMVRRILYDKPGLFSFKKGSIRLDIPKDILLVRDHEILPGEILETTDGFLHI